MIWFCLCLKIVSLGITFLIFSVSI
jgi:hypothetical protein